MFGMTGETRFGQGVMNGFPSYLFVAADTGAGLVGHAAVGDMAGETVLLQVLVGGREGAGEKDGGGCEVKIVYSPDHKAHGPEDEEPRIFRHLHSERRFDLDLSSRSSKMMLFHTWYQ